PAGKTITYSALARQVGCGSAQAVGQALKLNPFAPEVPCHRVLSADGSMGGYMGQREGEALELKRQLLKKEAEK
ncbi:MAG: MGMT family protein, partial [Bacteroidales bacterium]|nr:MGMT family protein [Bacteroidales bacterium]